MHLLFQILTHSFPDLWHPSRYGLEVPCGFWIFRLFHWFCVCSYSSSSSIWHSAYQTLTHWWNFQFCHLTGTRLANPFSYWGIPEPDFYVSPLDQSCMISLGYHWLTHYNPSIDWVLGSIFFWQLSQHKSKSSPSVETLLSSANLPKLLDPVPDIRASKLEGSNCFQLRISLPEVTGHSTTTSETKGRHEYHSWRLPWLHRHIQQIQSWKISWPLTIWS